MRFSGLLKRFDAMLRPLFLDLRRLVFLNPRGVRLRIALAPAPHAVFTDRDDPPDLARIVPIELANALLDRRNPLVDIVSEELQLLRRIRVDQISSRGHRVDNDLPLDLPNVREESTDIVEDLPAVIRNDSRPDTLQMRPGRLHVVPDFVLFPRRVGEHVGNRLHQIADEFGAVVEQFLQPITYHLQEFLDLARVTLLHVRHHRRDDRIAQRQHGSLPCCLAALDDLLSNQLQHRPRAEPKLGGGRRQRHDPDQVETEVDPVEHVDRFVAMLDHRLDIEHRIDCRKDIGQNRHVLRDRLQPADVDDAAADLDQPLVE